MDLGFNVNFCTDTMVLEGVAFVWSGWACQIPPVRYRYLKSSITRFWRFGGHERCPEIPNSSRWSFNWSFTISSHLVRVFFIDVIVYIFFFWFCEIFRFIIFFVVAVSISWTCRCMRHMISCALIYWRQFTNVRRDSVSLKWIVLRLRSVKGFQTLVLETKYMLHLFFNYYYFFLLLCQ